MDITKIYSALRSSFCKCKTAMPFDEIGTTLYFLPIFYFSNGGGVGRQSSGLLTSDYSLTIEKADAADIDIEYSKLVGDSAYNFLINNGDAYRANLLKTFNDILFTMANKAPWHFNKFELSIGEHYKNTFEGKYTEGRQFTLNLGPDTIDRMHHTLFSIYKELLWDSERDVVILPKNLRQFNMGVILFSQPTTFIDGRTTDEFDNVMKYIKSIKIDDDSYSDVNDHKTKYIFDYKNTPQFDTASKDIDIKNLFDMNKQNSWWQFIEFRGCEFDSNNIFEQLNISAGNEAVSHLDSSEKLVINYKKMYITTCERFFNVGVTDIPSQFDYIPPKNTPFGKSYRWNT